MVTHLQFASEGASRNGILGTFACQVSANLRLPDLTRDFHGGLRGTVRHVSQTKRHEEQGGTNANDPGLKFGGVSHTLRRFVHSSLSRKVVYLPLTGLLFNALAGIFFGLFLHYLNGQRKWWPLLLSGSFAGLGFWLIGFGLSLRA
tara:strand:+ start:35872 stop:36309 length:438 start_codon:yes stop_codon:yes gene_type:complete